MKLDHFVINVSDRYQKNDAVIQNIREHFPYEPSWGKGTKGFKASNLWIGSEYLEMIRILKENGGGWAKEWTCKYNQGHRGMIWTTFLWFSEKKPAGKERQLPSR